MPSAVRPLPQSPALVLEAGRARRALVIADLHLGLGANPSTPLGPPGASAPELVDRILGLCGLARAQRLIIAGDVKHPIVGVPAWLRPVIFDVFATVLDHGVLPEVILGNHDVGLEAHLPREVVVHPSAGLAAPSVGVFHGHRWPSDEVLNRPTLVAGHLHPGYRFAPTVGAPVGKQRCWVRVRFEAPDAVIGPNGRATRARELVVVPAFHPLAGTESLNRERPERGRSFLYQRFLGRGEARAYLLDGTDLGALPRPLPRVQRAASERAPPGR